MPLERLAPKHRGPRHGGRHHDDGAEGHKEEQVGGDPEAEGQGTALPKNSSTLAG